MADLTYRLPGKEPFSYVEVVTDLDELNSPDGENILREALDALNALFPSAGTATAGGYSRPAPASDPSLPDFAHCKHGDMLYKEGGSGRSKWKAYMCQSKDRNDRCQPRDAVSGNEWEKR